MRESLIQSFDKNISDIYYYSIVTTSSIVLLLLNKTEKKNQFCPQRVYVLEGDSENFKLCYVK